VEDHDKNQPAPSPLALRQRDWKYLTVGWKFLWFRRDLTWVIFFQFPMVLASAIAMFFANFYTPFGKALLFLVKKSV
jgi:hypothetical protein